MKQYLKPTILFVALLLPVVIFLFLKLFGENKFDIPVYYQNQEEIVSDISCVNANIKAPYIVDLFNADLFKGPMLNQIKDDQIILLAYFDSKDNSDLSYKIKRLQERLGEDYQMILFVDSLVDEDFSSQLLINTEVEYVASFWKCALLNDDYHQWVLLDTQKRIRGYYDSSEKEMDRLIVEMAILIKNND